MGLLNIYEKLHLKNQYEKVKQDIGVDFLGYNDPENLARAIGIPRNSMCFTCATGNYETLGIEPSFKSRHEMKGE